MIVTLPLPRWKIVTAKALALSISSFIIILLVAIVSFGVLQAIEGQIESDFTAINLFSAVLSTWPLVFAVAMLSMFFASFASSRRVASIIAAAVLAVGYFGSNLAASAPIIEPFEPFFLFTYLDAAGKAVVEGQALGDILVLLGTGLVAFTLAVFFFQKRRLTVGMWPWQRAKIEE